MRKRMKIFIKTIVYVILFSIILYIMWEFLLGETIFESLDL
jgi:hypothetical protein